MIPGGFESLDRFARVWHASTMVSVTSIPRAFPTSFTVSSTLPTTEVLEAENQCLRLQIEKRDCSEQWTEVKSRKKSKVAVRKTSRDQLREEKISIDSKQKQHNKRKNSNRSKGKTHQKTKGQKLKPNQQPNDRSFQTSILRLKSITIRGDSHTRHVAGMVMKLIGPGTSVSGMCKPGAKLLDIIQPDQTSTGPGPRCEVLIAGTNDLAVGEQCNIYRYLEDYIVARPPGAELLLATLPHRHDLDPDHPVHEETVLVNAFVEELAARHNVRLLKLDGVGRGYFTRHGQHFSMRGKRLLAEMIVRALASSVPESSLGGSAVAIAPSAGPLSAEVLGERAGTLQSSPNLQHLSYADTVRGSPGESETERFPVSKNLVVPTHAAPT
ncbi:hypothetical protein J6590_074388 [Homalodisca vitripennis]|nr:hypothetical protein J6590_074388 [Homalodisca vitripennis]